jgi:hypothetical protein
MNNEVEVVSLFENGSQPVMDLRPFYHQVELTCPVRCLNNPSISSVQADEPCLSA